jgi:hypothetical protein
MAGERHGMYELALSVSRPWPRRTTHYIRTTEAITEFVWAVVHHPPNSPYFTPLDMHIFGPSEDMDDPLNAVRQWLQRFDDLRRAGMSAVTSWGRAVNKDVDFVKK